jgi:hypothetical protein
VLPARADVILQPVRLLGRVRTVGELVAHFLHRRRFFLAPLLLVLLLAALLLLAATGLSYVSPFVYTLF